MSRSWLGEILLIISKNIVQQLHSIIQWYTITIQWKTGVETLYHLNKQDRILEEQDNIRPVARKILQPRHYFKRCTRIEFYTLLALYHADSKIVVCVDWFSYFLLLHRWSCSRLNLLNTYAKTNEQTNKKKTGNFNQGECPGSPHTGYGPEYSHEHSLFIPFYYSFYSFRDYHI